MENWKKQLLDLGAKSPELNIDDNEEPNALEEYEKEREKMRTSYEEQKVAETEEKKKDENDPDFQSLVKLYNLKPGSKVYYRIRDLFYNARRGDVEYDVNRWLNHKAKVNLEVEEICERLKRQGYESAAHVWWLSSQPEGMKTGTGSKELRLKKAEEYASKAGKNLNDILKGRLEI